MDIIVNIVLTFIGGLIGFIIGAAILLIILPIYAAFGIFVNKPEGLNKSGFHLFTKLAPGQVKIIDREGKLVRMIMDVGGKKFARTGGNPDQAEYWEIVPSLGKKEDPTDGVWQPIHWWARIVYEQTGAVFIGIYPFARIREYNLERTEVERTEEQHNEEQRPDSKKSNLLLTVKSDLSDHFRAKEFQFPMRITAAETADKIGLDIIGVAEMEVENPHKAAYGTDRWDQKVINLVTDAIIAKTKGMKLDQALNAKSEDIGEIQSEVNPEDIRAIQSAVKEITDDTKICGIQIKGFRILEIKLVLDAKGLEAIQAEAMAIQKAKATVIDGEARAKSLTAINKANEAGGKAALATMQAEALVRAAEAAGKNGSVILMPGSNNSNEVDSTQIAILAELKKLNEKGSKS